MNKCHTNLVETISKDDIHSRTIGDEYVSDGEPDIWKRILAWFFISRKFIGGVSSNFTNT